MHDKSSTFGLNRKKLSHLWRIGKDIPQQEEGFEEEQRKSDLLQAQLSESLPLEVGMQHLLPDILSAVCRKFKPFIGCSIKDLLLDPETDLLIIKTIKDLHKKRAESAPSGLQQDVTTAVYYAAIASALVYHDIKITKFSYKVLGSTLTEMSQNKWLTTDLKILFGRAHELCSKHVYK
ncbi:MAG: hypothetical protein ACYS3S_20355 [Planctomycetota bacterium]|jgi:hypothetical protein